MRTISRNPRNYRHESSDHESPEGVSKTVPNMTMPLKDLLERFTRGQAVATLNPVYNGDEDLPDFERMDPMDRLDYARDIRMGIRQTQDEMARAQEAAKKAAEMQAQNPDSEDFEEPIVLDETKSEPT